MDIFTLRNDLETNKIRPDKELLGGMMNKSFIISLEGKKYVWYVPTEQANEMVDRKLEKRCLDMVYPLGITSKNIAFYDDGMKINEFIEGISTNLTNEFDINKISIMLHKLHDSKLTTGVSYEPFKKIEGYNLEAKTLRISLSEDFEKLYSFLNSNKEFLQSQKQTICHNDFQRSNIVKSLDDNYYMIDFEFMMDNDPIYDIAAFGNNVVEEGLDLLKVYFDNKQTKQEEKRFYLWRIFLSLQWYLVALIKDKRGEGKAHGINFVDVANFFLSNAKHAKELLG